jgi:hypothetical protein
MASELVEQPEVQLEVTPGHETWAAIVPALDDVIRVAG